MQSLPSREDKMSIEPQTITLFAKFAAKFAGPIFGLAGRAAAKLAEGLTLNLAAYYEATIARCSNVRTLISRDQSIPIDSIYVPTYLSAENKTINEDDFLELIPRVKAMIICGSGGSGKSIFMRHLFLSLANGMTAALPILVELRGINALASSKIIPYVYHSLVLGPGSVISEKQFELGVKEGAIYLILDGFDEVSPETRSSLEKELIELQRNNPKMVMIVTSREDERFSSWQNFAKFNVLPMKKKEVVELLKKLPYEKTIRNKFAEAVRVTLYDKHESFLSNPLLATMMLITYEQFAQIPDKIHIFYEQAFETLFFRHDTLKEAGFERKRHADLAINEFKNCLSALCISTYVKARFQFTEAEILDAITAACQHEKLSVKPAAVLRDLIESVCIMQRDGTMITFTHRSFQEYFSACFISRSPSIDLADLLDKLSLQPQDKVISMALDINRPLVERIWIFPRIEVLRRIAKKYNKSQPISFAKEAIGEFYLQRMKAGSSYRTNLSLRNERFHRFALIINDLYPEFFKNVFEPININNFLDENETARWFEKSRGVAKSQKNKSLDDGRIHLTSSDNEWVASTNIGTHFERFRRAILTVGRHVEKSVRDAESSGKTLVLLK
jgi:NACHT domain